MDDLKNRRRLTTSVDKGIYKAFVNYSLDTMIPASRMMDEALADYLNKKNVKYELQGSYRKKVK